MKRFLGMVGLLAGISLSGCGWFGGDSKSSAPQTPAVVVKSLPQAPRVIVKRVPCSLKVGPLQVELTLNLGELKELVLDAKQLYGEIIAGELGSTPPDDKTLPVILVVNKQTNKLFYLQLTPHIKEVRLSDKGTKGVTLVVKNQTPCQVELWVDSPQDIRMDVEFKEETSKQ
jgi:hypothetical protein